jgi:hypothetical protein
MKRTKEAFFRVHPHTAGREAVSGCREFDGEDLDYYERKKFYNDKQRQWLDQQLQEKREEQARQKFDDRVFAEQQKRINEMRIKLEE